ncbi:MAG: glycosyltransferase [Proteobacteria bacterium]|nr:glycosyltransferase [Pseudomonadota bacterium]
MTPDLVSIVIPTYNQAHFLREAVACVVKQTWSAWELIIVNNHSTDDTKSVADSFNHPNIKCVDFKNHGIIAASRNHGITLAKGEYIAFLDSDDTWEPDKLNRCIQKLKEGFDLVCHGEFHFVEGGSAPYPVKYGPAARTAYGRLISEGNCLSTSAIVVRRNFLANVGSFSIAPEFNTAEDYDLWLKLSGSAAKIAILDDMLGSYRIHPMSASASSLKNARATLEVLNRHINNPCSPISLKNRLKCWILITRIKFFIFRAIRLR